MIARRPGRPTTCDNGSLYIISDASEPAMLQVRAAPAEWLKLSISQRRQHNSQHVEVRTDQQSRLHSAALLRHCT
eukprot:5868793-Prymnesium_polylepis.1